MKRVLFLFALLLGFLAVHAGPSAGKIEVSVLTCSPGQEVYSLYGHTAIRVQDRESGEDYVFNYGVFDFNSEHFVWNFVLGRTDYICMAAPYAYFLHEYQARGSSVVAQVLNLTESEAAKVREYLYRNIRRENCVYRYNYLTSNCTTKVMDCVESCVEGTLVYSWAEEPRTYRGIMHEYTRDFPWAQDGNDILLGADVDTLLSYRATCFVPGYYMNALEGAVVRNEFQDTRKFVRETVTLVQANPAAAKASSGLLPDPVKTGWCAFGIAMLILLLEFAARKVFWLLDVLVMLVHGAAGCLVTFVFFFSEHPTLDSNWLVGVLNPLPLLALPFVIKAAWNGRRSMWHYFMAVWFAVFLLFMPWMPQHMPAMTVPVLLVLLSRQVSYILHYRRIPLAGQDSRRKKTQRKKK